MLTDEQVSAFSGHLNLLLSFGNVTVSNVQYKMGLFELFKKYYDSPNFPTGDVIRDGVLPKLEKKYNNKKREKMLNELCFIWDEWKYICDEMLQASVFRKV